MVDPLPHDTRALVRPSQALAHFRLQRWRPGPPLGRFVDWFWRTEWHLDEPFVQPIVTYPAVNVVVQADGSFTATGVQTGNDGRRIEGDGWAIGAKFRVAGFRPFTTTPVSTITGWSGPAEHVLGATAGGIAAAVVAATDPLDAVAAMAAGLGPLAPTAPTTGEALSDLVEAAVAEDPPVTRVDELAARAGTSVRSLQRRFAEHVGLSPKAVLERYRAQAAGEAALDPDQPWAEVAVRLGYADQAHLTQDLRTHFGAPPAQYARAEAAGRSDERGVRSR
ncbi:MAG: helix-turn-helix transcriptional regulator [Actinomycetota bacterium]